MLGWIRRWTRADRTARQAGGVAPLSPRPERFVGEGRGDTVRHEIAPPPTSPVDSPWDIAALCKLLTESTAERRRSACQALGRRGEDARDSIPRLVLAATDIDEGVRATAASALMRIDPAWQTDRRVEEAVDELINRVFIPLKGVGTVARGTLTQIGALAVPGLLRRLAAEVDGGRRAIIADVLGRIGPAAADAVPALSKELYAKDGHTRRAAAEALASIQIPYMPAMLALIAILDDRDPETRQFAAKYLACFGEDARGALPALIPLLGDPADEVRESATVALARIGRHAARPLALLVRAGSSAPFQQLLVDWLADAVARYNQDVKRLQQGESVVLTRPYDDEKAQAIRREPVKAITSRAWHARMLIDDVQRMTVAREAATRALGLLGADATEALPALVSALRDDQVSGVRAAAAWSLGQLRVVARTALRELVESLVDPYPTVRKAAAVALPQVNPEWTSDQAVTNLMPRLVARLNEVAEARKVETETLILIGPAAVPALVEALDVPDRRVQEAAAVSLGEMGKNAAAAVCALTRVRDLPETHGWVRDAATKALAKIEKP